MAHSTVLMIIHKIAPIPFVELFRDADGTICLCPDTKSRFPHIFLPTDVVVIIFYIYVLELYLFNKVGERRCTISISSAT